MRRAGSTEGWPQPLIWEEAEAQKQRHMARQEQEAARRGSKRGSSSGSKGAARPGRSGGGLDAVFHLLVYS